MAFKLGSEKRKHVSSLKFGRMAPVDTNINRVNMPGNTLAEANMDGTINVDPSVDLNSPLGKRVIKHEQKHLEQIESGKAAYNDNVVMWEGKLYFRKHINGEDVIDGPNGRWPEGDKNHPWEQEAIQAEKSPLKNYKKGYYGIK